MRSQDCIAVDRITTRDREVLALPGEFCGRVPQCSLEGLMQLGAIRLASVPEAGKVAAVEPPEALLEEGEEEA